MSFLVINCFHWIGFHLVNSLLENGHDVGGIILDDSNNQDHLLLFVGRNSLFSVIAETETRIHDISIKVNSDLKLDRELDSNSHENQLIINLPLLFGRWMPMNEHGMYYENEFISFDSELFLTKAVYITDYIQGLYDWMETVDIFEEENKEITEYTYIPKKRPIQSQLEKVLVHYKRFYKLYI